MFVIGLRLPETLEHKIERAAKQLQRSKSFIIRKAVEAYMDEYVDYQIALERLNDKDDEIITSSEMRGLVEGKHKI